MIKLPETPPATGNDTSSRFWQQLEEKLAPLEKGYLHWDDIKDKTMPVSGINQKQWWQLLKAKRRARLQRLPFTFTSESLYWVLDDQLLKRLTRVERLLAIELPKCLQHWLPANRFIDEVIANLALSTESYQQDAAQQLLRTGKPANNTQEQLTEQHYQDYLALDTTSVQDWLQHYLLHTEPYQRIENDQVLFTAPEVEAIKPGLEQLIAFCNQSSEAFTGFMHPVIKAIIAHFAFVSLSPLQEHNEFVARQLFTHQLLNSGYDSIAFVALSNAIASNYNDYLRSLLLTQTDSNDATYFILSQLALLEQAILDAMSQIEQQKKQLKKLPAQLTLRQQFILHEMQQQPLWKFRLARYKTRMDITYETSRTDLMKLAELGFANKNKIGKAFVYQKV